MTNKQTSSYGTWSAMRRRCRNPNTVRYERYGGRGIKVCERWDSFANFFADMGEKPAGMSIDRIDVNGNYEPGNCRWATATEQSQNNNSNVKLEPHEPAQIRWLSAEGFSGAEIARFFGVGKSTVSRVLRGRSWTVAA